MLRCTTQILLRIALVGILFALVGCTLIQPPEEIAEKGALVTPSATPVSEEERIRAIIEASAQEIFAPAHPYSATFLSTVMGMPALWVDYSVTKFDTLHGYIHSNEPATIAFECEQAASNSRFFPQPLPSNSVQFRPCNLPFQLLANTLPMTSEFSNIRFMKEMLPEPTFSSFVSLGQREVALQLVPARETAPTVLAEGYQFQSATGEVELWVDVESGLPLLLNNVPNEDSAFVPFMAFSFLLQPAGRP